MNAPSRPARPAARTTSIGILAHVDAGKTSLTERLLYDTGAIERLGSVDAGTTRTDSGSVERSRGITIRTAVAAFAVGDRQVNLVDTPGHADFAAEVERALGVLDGAVLVLSAVEGVQPQTRLLMRTLRAMRLPTLLFVNKTDRAGARRGPLLDDIRRLLTPHLALPGPAFPGGDADRGPVPPLAEVLAEYDEGLLADFVEGRVPDPARLRAVLAEQTAAARLHPVYFGSARTGLGVPELLDGMARLLPPAPAAAPGADRRPRGTVFAVERGPRGRRTALIRLDAGELAERRRVVLHRRTADGAPSTRSARVTAVRAVTAGTGHPSVLTAGNIGRVDGLEAVRVGDLLADPGGGPGPDRDAPDPGRRVPPFPHPALETVVRPAEPGPDAAARLHAALAALADEDPLIRTRVLPGGALSVLLHGEVQKEVLAAVLADEFGVHAVFAPSSPVYLERPTGQGEARAELDRRSRPDFPAAVGFRVAPAPPGAGTVYRLEVEAGSLPHAFHRAIEETVHRTLTQGLHGWPVVDCAVALTHSGYWSPVSTAGDFRNLVPMVLMRALHRAGTAVHEPCHAYELTVPPGAVGPAGARLAAAEATLDATAPGDGGWVLRGSIPARRVADVKRDLPGLGRGEALWWSRPEGERPVRGGGAPSRPRTDGDPLHREAYLRRVARGGRTVEP